MITDILNKFDEIIKNTSTINRKIIILILKIILSLAIMKLTL